MDHRHLPLAPPPHQWIQPVLEALAPVLQPAEATIGRDIVASIDSGEPWLTLVDWPLPPHAVQPHCMLLLAWEDRDAALYLPDADQQALQALGIAVDQPPGPSRSAAGRAVAAALQSRGWCAWQRQPLDNPADPGAGMVALLARWQQTLQGPGRAHRADRSHTDLARVREALVGRGGQGQGSHPAAILPEALAAELARTVHGQRQAIDRIALHVAQHIAKPQPQCPAVVWATGSTGVGKTLTAMHVGPALNALEGLPEHDSRRWRTVRLDMNEYQEPHRVAELRGAPAGYLGHGRDSPLVAALRQGPRVVLVFDEIEKAHPDLPLSLMNLLEAGRMSVPHAAGAGQGQDGHQLDCREAIVVLTSNLDAAGMVSEYHADRPDDDLDLALRRRLVRAGIRPELAGRMGACVAYLPIGDEARVDIVLAEVQAAGREYGVAVRHVCPELVVQILRQPAHSNFGARSDRRATGRVLGTALLQARHAGWSAVRLLSNPTRAEPCE